MGTETKRRLPRNPFLDAVRKSGLLAPDDLIGLLSHYDPEQVEAADPIHIATFLVRKKLLTKFQAMQLLNGRTQGLINDVNETSVAVLNLIVSNKDKFKNVSVPSSSGNDE